MDFVTSRAALRQIYGLPSDKAVRKKLTRLDGHCRAFIEKSPFVLIGSTDGAGNADVSPKGDRPGFATVIDDHTIAIPDRPGNNRLDTLENVIADPAIGLLFVIPGMAETLRVNGRARITADTDLCARLGVDGKPALTVMLVELRACYMHCAKAFMRSGLWQPDGWPSREAMPTLGQILRDQLALPQSAADLDRGLDESYRKSLW